MYKKAILLSFVLVVNTLLAQPPRIYEMKKKEFFSTAFSRDGNLMASGDLEGDLVVWDVEKQSILHDLTGQYGNVLSTVFSPDGYYVAAGATDGSIHVYMITNGLMDKKFTGKSWYDTANTNTGDYLEEAGPRS